MRLGWASRGRKMGLAALAASRPRREHRRAGGMTGLHEQISVLISTHTSDLDEIERTLTDGYAQVLQLEAEKFRLEKRIAEVAQSLHGSDSTDQVREISSLAKR